MNGEEAAAMEGEGSDEEDTTFKKMLRSKNFLFLIWSSIFV